MQQYKNTGVYLAASCTTAQLLAAGKTSEAAKAFAATTESFEKTFTKKEDRDWLMAVSRGQISVRPNANPCAEVELNNA